MILVLPPVNVMSTGFVTFHEPPVKSGIFTD